MGLQECSSQLARHQEEIQTQGRPLRNGEHVGWGESRDGNSGREQMGNREAGWESSLLSLLRMLPLTASQNPRAVGSPGTSPAALASPWQLWGAWHRYCLLWVTRTHQQHNRKANVTHTRLRIRSRFLTQLCPAGLASTCFSLGHTLSPVPVCSWPQGQEKDQHIRKIWDEQRGLVRACPGMVKGVDKHFLLGGEQAG